MNWEETVAEEKANDELHQLWQNKIDKGFNAYIMDVSATYDLDKAGYGFWTHKYLLPFEKEKMQIDIEEWKELMTHKFCTGVAKFEKKKIRCKSVEELYD